jgi:RNA polymerase sigma-70 factor (ECF subfamily)
VGEAPKNLLIVTPVDGAGSSPLTVGPCGCATIGRAEDCELRVDDATISKHHARIAWCEGSWQVTDLGSRNGTSINRWTLTPNEPVIVHDGDTLAVGPLRFELRLAAEGEDEGGGSRTPPSTWATRASIFQRLRDDRRSVQEVGWEEFRARYARVIVGFCRNAGLPVQDAEDILQDVMMGFFRRAGDFEYDPTKGRFRGYLKRATLNAIRKRARHREAASAVPEEWLEERAGEAESRWEEAWAEQMLARAMDEARRRFDGRTIEAFELYGRHGVPAAEVAHRLGMSVNGVHQAKSRVLNFVRAVIDGLRADEG